MRFLAAAFLILHQISIGLQQGSDVETDANKKNLNVERHSGCQASAYIRIPSIEGEETAVTFQIALDMLEKLGAKHGVPEKIRKKITKDITVEVATKAEVREKTLRDFEELRKFVDSVAAKHNVDAITRKAILVEFVEAALRQKLPKDEL